MHIDSTLRQRSRLHDVGAVGAGVLVAVFGLVAAIAVPTPALVASVALGLFVGVLTGVGVGFVEDDPRRGARVALTTAVVAVPVVVAGVGLIAVLGPTSVVVLPALIVVAGVVWWLGRDGRRVEISRAQG